MPDIVQCSVCLATRSSLFTRSNGLDLLVCNECGTVYVYPPPTPTEVREIYADISHGATTGYFAKVDKKMRRSRHRIRAMRRYIPAKGRFLDVGCSGGFMVEAAREVGLIGTGLDLEPPSIAYARLHHPTCDFFCGTVEEFADTAPGLFDVIYTSEVIEHVPEVRAFCLSIAKLLRPGGLLYVTTPDLMHWSQPRDVHRRSGFCPPAHCVYFTPRSLIGLLESFGFRLIRRRLAFKPGIKLICRKREEPTTDSPA